MVLHAAAALAVATSPGIHLVSFQMKISKQIPKEKGKRNIYLQRAPTYAC